MFLAFHMQGRIEQDRIQPIVTVETGRWILVQYDPFHSGKQFLIELAGMLMVGDMFIQHRHLATSDTGTDIRHTIVVADLLMLIIRIRLTGLRSIEHDLLFRFFVRTDQSPTT